MQYNLLKCTKFRVDGILGYEVIAQRITVPTDIKKGAPKCESSSSSHVRDMITYKRSFFAPSDSGDFTTVPDVHIVCIPTPKLLSPIAPNFMSIKIMITLIIINTCMPIP